MERIDAKGGLFKNDRKTSSGHPDYTGNFIMTRALLEAYVKQMGGGTEIKVQLGAWIKQSTKPGGANFLSLSVNAPYEGRGAGQPASAPATPAMPKEDLPF